MYKVWILTYSYEYRSLCFTSYIQPGGGLNTCTSMNKSDHSGLVPIYLQVMGHKSNECPVVRNYMHHNVPTVLDGGFSKVITGMVPRMTSCQLLTHTLPPYISDTIQMPLMLDSCSLLYVCTRTRVYIYIMVSN